jgi:hypothetical protein
LAIKKTKLPVRGEHFVRTAAAPDENIRFSFRHFDGSDEEICPRNFPDGYTRTLIERMRDISQMTVREFTSNKSRALRAHTHDWSSTKRPDGFDCLNEQFRALPGWQFELTVNAHGRVHGFMIDNTFYVVWLDRDHVLYDGGRGGQ